MVQNLSKSKDVIQRQQIVNSSKAAVFSVDRHRHSEKETLEHLSETISAVRNSKKVIKNEFKKQIDLKIVVPNISKEKWVGPDQAEQKKEQNKKIFKASQNLGQKELKLENKWKTCVQPNQTTKN